MFFGCSNLTYLDLSDWDTSNIYGMTSMFADCINLTEIVGIADWNVHNVNSFAGMFQNCSSIKNLDIKNWNMQNAHYLENIFFHLPSLENLYLNNVDFNTEVMEGTYNMFEYVDNEANIYVKDQDTAKFIYNHIGRYPDKYKIYYGTEDNWTEYTI